MNCNKVRSRLSPFLDDMLQNDPAAEISHHLAACPECRNELARLAKLRGTLRTLGRATTPEYLEDLVKIRIESARQNSWHANVRDTVEYCWSRIRTTDSLWYWTRLSGTVVTIVFFAIIYASMNPYFGLSEQLRERGGISQTLRMNLLKNLGLMPVEAQKKPISPSEPKINDLNFVNFGQNAARTARNDTVSVVTVVDRNGEARVQDVLEYPADTSLLSDFADMIMSARWRPASLNGRAVDAHLVMTFSKVYVYN